MPGLLQRGQIGLIVVLIMAVGLTIGLAIASQSLTDISVTETEEQSLRAFNAAEAGIETLLSEASLTPVTASPVPVGDLTANVSVSEGSGQTITLNRNETTEVNLSSGTATQVKISWVNENDSIQNPATCLEGAGNAPASIEVLRLRRNEVSGDILPYHYLYNACVALDAVNGFANSRPADAPSLVDEPGNYLKSITFTNIESGSDTTGDDTYDVSLRIRTFYNQATFKIEGAGLPTQEYQITSSATTDTGETRTIEVGRTVEAWPPIFDYALFSGGELSK